MKTLVGARPLKSMCIGLLCVNLCVMFLRGPQPALAQEKKVEVQFTFQMEHGLADQSDKLIDKLNKAGEKGWRAKGMSMTGGQMYVLMEKEK